VPPIAATLEAPQTTATQAVAEEARRGLTSTPKSLAPWLFYDEAGSRLFEQITALPEYYLTRTERDLFTAHADEIFELVSHSPGCPTSRRDVGSPNLTIAELGAGTAAKTGILLRALTQQQPHVLYQPIDISPTALDEARETIQSTIPNVTVRPQAANYITDTVRIERPPHTRILALYIGSSIGNFSPIEARAILTRLRSELEPGDALLLGADLAPCLAELTPSKSVSTLLAAYNDKAGITAAFNRNILTRLNRDLGANFRPELFAHRAHWNHTHSRIEMHLQPLAPHTVQIPAASGAAEVSRSATANGASAVNGAAGANGASGGALTLHFTPGETIHTENSYKFTPAAIRTLLSDTRFTPTRTFTDPANLFAVTLATAT
jgi:dimethylhistidine N-methyltransferase